MLSAEEFAVEVVRQVLARTFGESAGSWVEVHAPTVEGEAPRFAIVPPADFSTTERTWEPNGPQAITGRFVPSWVLDSAVDTLTDFGWRMHHDERVTGEVDAWLEWRG